MSVLTYIIGQCRLRYHLANKKMSQQEFANRIQKSKQTVSRYVNDQIVMSYETALNAAMVLDCQMEELYEKRKASIKE